LLPAPPNTPQMNPAAWLGCGSMISPTGVAWMCICSTATPAPPAGLIRPHAFGSQPQNCKHMQGGALSIRMPFRPGPACPFQWGYRGEGTRPSGCATSICNLCKAPSPHSALMELLPVHSRLELPPLHEIKVLKRRCAIKMCAIDSARRQHSVGERAVG
jgi:hypothetical protein